MTAMGLLLNNELSAGFIALTGTIVEELLRGSSSFGLLMNCN